MQRIYRTVNGLVLLSLIVGTALAERHWIPLDGDRGAPPEVEVLSSNSSFLRVRIGIPGFYVEEVSEGGETYQRITLPRAGTTPDVGSPGLPLLGRIFCLPGGTIARVTSTERESEVFTGYRVLPTQEPLPDLDLEPDFTIDVEAYGRDVAYPSRIARTGEIGILRDLPVSQLLVHPMQFNPIRGELTVHRDLILEITFESDPSARKAVSRPFSRAFLPLYREHVLNFGELYGTSRVDGGQYLIVTADEYADALDPLVEWKHRKGVPVVLTRLSDIGASPDTQDIRGYILDAYVNWTVPPEYVLLVGDVDDVPCNYGMTHPYHGSPTANDQYYARLEGDDIFADVFLGRFSVNDVHECSTLVKKVLTYEVDPYMEDPSWYTRATLVIGNQAGRPWEWTMRAIQGILFDHGFTEVDTLMELYGACLADSVTASLNEGSAYLTYRGHGGEDGWYNVSPPYTNYHLENILDNGNKLPVVIAPTCNTAWYDWSGGDCFAENWCDEGEPDSLWAAASMFASTRVSYSFHNDTLAIGCYRSIFEDSLIHFTAATDGGKVYMSNFYSIYDPITQVTFEMFNTFGDPELTLWTGMPESLQVAHDAAISTGPATLDVQVDAGGLPVEGARVCAAGDSVYVLEQTDLTGLATLSFTTPMPDTLTVTVTGQNLIPYRGDVVVIPDGPWVRYQCHEIVDSLGWNPDGAINPGEPIEMPMWIRNWGNEPAESVTAVLRSPDSLVLVGDSVVCFGTVAAFDSAAGMTTFGFEVLPACTNGHRIEFEVAIADTSEEWVDTFGEPGFTPILSLARYSFEDSSAGNFNGIFEPGETVTLYFHVENTGGAPAMELYGTVACVDTFLHFPEDSFGVPAVMPGDTSESDAVTLTADPGCEPPHDAYVGVDLSALVGYAAADSFFILVGEVCFEDDMEDDTAGWSHYAVSPDFRDDWMLTDYRNHTPEGACCWKCGGDSSSPYGAFLDAALETPEFPIGVRTALTFWHWMCADTSSVYPGECYDGGVVELCLPGGEWVQLEPDGGYPYVFRGGQFCPFEAGIPCFSGAFDWRRERFDLSSHAGLGKIRFRFGSNQSMNLEGWYVDDVWIGQEAAVMEGALSGSDRVLRLLAPAPNPFRGCAVLSYSLPEAREVILSLYDASGRRVRVLDRGAREAGTHVLQWKGRDDRGVEMPSGVYFCRLLAGKDCLTRKMLLLR
jgi:hypothetical protein